CLSARSAMRVRWAKPDAFKFSVSEFVVEELNIDDPPPDSDFFLDLPKKTTVNDGFTGFTVTLNEKKRFTFGNIPSLLQQIRDQEKNNTVLGERLASRFNNAVTQALDSPDKSYVGVVLGLISCLVAVAVLVISIITRWRARRHFALPQQPIATKG